MRAIAKTTWIELKLFGREPLTVVFTLALPLVLLFVLGNVFGNQPNPSVYRGVGPMDYYVPAYVALVVASIGLIGLPVHLAGYRERGVLRRFRASTVPLWSVLGGQVVVTLVVGVAVGVVVGGVAAAAFHVAAPRSPALVAAAFLLTGLCFASIGLFLGWVLPTARAAQGAGVILWFVLLIVSGAGPPPEVLNGVLRWVGDAGPLRHAVILLQDPWLGYGWNGPQTLVVAAFAIVPALVTLVLARRT